MIDRRADATISDLRDRGNGAGPGGWLGLLAGSFGFVMCSEHRLRS